jgi:hypothetical protein
MYLVIADPNDITSIPVFIHIRPVVLELNHADRQTRSALYAFISCTLSKERIATEGRRNGVEQLQNK